MAVFTGQVLSGSTNGLPISVTATSTPGTLIHTAHAGTTSFDELYIFASNVSASPATLTIEWGGMTDPSDLLVKAYSIPANSPAYPISAGQRLNNSKAVRAFSSASAAINITGWINWNQG